MKRDAEKVRNTKKDEPPKKKADVRKKLIIIISALLVATVLLGVASFAIDKYNFKKNNNALPPINYDFYPADFEENIYEDEEYIDLIENGFLYYTDESMGVTVGIERETAINYGKDIQFMVEYVYTIINGEADKYNAYFSDTYYKYHNKHEPYTMQKLHDVNIAKLEEIQESDRKNGNYTRYEFSLSYKIYENNGTFRNDIGDGYRTQYISVSNKNGKMLIDSITVPKIKVS